jgi:hypothetical protein
MHLTYPRIEQYACLQGLKTSRLHYRSDEYVRNYKPDTYNHAVATTSYSTSVLMTYFAPSTTPVPSCSNAP